jgi:hypothetical protein
MIYRVRTTQPSEPTSGSPHGQRQFWLVSEATLAGPRINAQLLAPGSDWMWMSPDGFWRPDVRVQFRTDDDAVVLMHYTGLVQQTDAFAAAAESNSETDWSDQYMRLAIEFDTGDERYAWLTTALYVAAGRLLGTGNIEYAVHRVT